MKNILDISHEEREEMAKKYMLEESYGAPNSYLYVGFLAGFHAAYKIVINKNEEKMERVNKIKDELEALITKAIDILEKECNVDEDMMSPQVMAIYSLNDALFEVSELEEQDLKAQD
jgi:cysteine sulfinate desulfinase/cysteine desulfurase-like protein